MEFDGDGDGMVMVDGTVSAMAEGGGPSSVVGIGTYSTYSRYGRGGVAGKLHFPICFG